MTGSGGALCIRTLHQVFGSHNTRSTFCWSSTILMVTRWNRYILWFPLYPWDTQPFKQDFYWYHILGSTGDCHSQWCSQREIRRWGFGGFHWNVLSVQCTTECFDWFTKLLPGNSELEWRTTFRGSRKTFILLAKLPAHLQAEVQFCIDNVYIGGSCLSHPALCLYLCLY